MPRLRPTIRDLQAMGDPLYTNDWIVVLLMPNELISRFSDDVQAFFRGDREPYTFSLMASAISLPNFQTNVGEINLSGGFKIRYPMTYDHGGQINLQVYDDHRNKATKSLWAWYNLVHEIKGAGYEETPFRDDRPLYAIGRHFKATMEIYLHRRAARIDPNTQEATLQTPLYFTFFGVYPVAMNFPELNSSNSGEPYSLNLTLSYDYAAPTGKLKHF